MNRFAALLISFTACLGLVSCGGGSSNSTARALSESCSLNSDCAKGLVCALGRCRVRCRSSADCSGGTCITDGTGGVCQPLAEKNSPCQRPRDCAQPLACAADYRCRNLCQTSADCNVLGVSGRVCATDSQGVRYCAETPEVDEATGTLATKPPMGAPDAAVIEPPPGSLFSGGAIAFPIGPAGGTVGLGALTITIPPDALDRTVTISITPTTPPVPGSIGQTYEIGPTGTTFLKPVTIAIAYALAELTGRAASDFSVSTVVGGKWKAVSGPIVDTNTQTIGGTTTHLSPYALAANGIDTGDGGVEPDASGAGGAAGTGTAGGTAGGSASAGTGGTGTSVDASADTPAGDGSAVGSDGGGVGAVCSASEPCASTFTCCNARCVPAAFNCPIAKDAGADTGGSTTEDAAAEHAMSTGMLSAVCHSCLGAMCQAEANACGIDATCAGCANASYATRACTANAAFLGVAKCGCSGTCRNFCMTECLDLGM
jgi:hypothetical protein